MKFLIDRCAGRVVAKWLRAQGHDVVEATEREPDPGDRVLLEWAASESRILYYDRYRLRTVSLPRKCSSPRTNPIAGCYGSGTSKNHRGYSDALRTAA